jgi:hypothetical protein
MLTEILSAVEKDRETLRAVFDIANAMPDLKDYIISNIVQKNLISIGEKYNLTLRPMNKKYSKKWWGFSFTGNEKTNLLSIFSIRFEFFNRNFKQGVYGFWYTKEVKIPEDVKKFLDAKGFKRVGASFHKDYASWGAESFISLYSNSIGDGEYKILEEKISEMVKISNECTLSLLN